MPHSSRWSNTSAPCRIEWRPSRALAGAILGLAVLAAFSVQASEMPRPLAWPVALFVLAWGGWRARRELRRARREWVFPGSDAPVLLDGEPVAAVQLEWRGPLAFVRWRARSGRVGRLSWWPDTLPAARRRELRLAALPGKATRSRPAMAPYAG
ncbi:hypothetical protein J5837_13480 [Pseudoxanthomonas helianthi]|uniref:Toxin CptA n=2 Tax=Pseudoxanthomonas helianthi TaxID=1453541 RepID=A0A940X3S0_9GAMM|nr:hypothetical protein [Pseudoxanthomonas helianthi]